MDLMMHWCARGEHWSISNVKYTGMLISDEGLKP